MKTDEVFTYLNDLYPENTACDFDNVGLLVGDYNKEFTKALIALDCNLKTIKSAVELGCNLIITHHPVIFEPLKKVIANSVVYELIRNDITVISMHTNLDIGKCGVNDCLCEKIGLKNIQKFIASDGYALNEGTVSPISPKEFAKHLKTALGGVIKFNDTNKMIEKVLVCSGSGGNFITDAVVNGFDALVTAEVKHNQFLSAEDSGISLFDAGHFNTEDIVVEPLKSLLSKKFPNAEFIANHNSPIIFK